MCLLAGQSGLKDARIAQIMMLPLLASVFCLLAALPPKADSLKLLLRRDHGNPERP
jgi:hypothetical protein